jgi:16S rRNA processing protein RimM
MTRRDLSAGSQNNTGSPEEGEPVFLAIGRLRRPHGVRGEIQMEVLTDFPERIKPGARVYAGLHHLPLTVRSARWHDRVLLIAFERYHTPEEAGELRNQPVFVTVADRPPLAEDEYYHHQILGLRAIDENQRLLGTVVEILETGANDVYVIRPEGALYAAVPDTAPDAAQPSPERRKPSLQREILLPATEETILEIDLARGEMKVHLLPGLIEE